MPSPWPTCGLWGSPSTSVWAWCLRWSATQAITDPWTAIDPRVAKRYSVGLCVRNERWVRRRWYPTVIPVAVSRYITARMARAVGLTRLFQKRTIGGGGRASFFERGRAGGGGGGKGPPTAPRLTSLVLLVIVCMLQG